MKDRSKPDVTETARTALEAVALAREQVDALRHQLDKADEQLRETVRTLATQSGVLPRQ